MVNGGRVTGCAHGRVVARVNPNNRLAPGRVSGRTIPMTSVTVPVDDRWLASAGCNPAELQRELTLILAAKLFELRKLTLGQAAEMAGLPVWSFMEALSRLGVSVINLTDEQLTHELGQA